jgi:uncharacterized membrane protein YbhN (UPF0104 family)
MNYLVPEKNFESHVRTRKWFYRIAFWLLATVLLFVLVRHSNWQQTFLRLSDTPLTTLLVCTAIWTLSFVFRALRFQSEWKKFGQIPFQSSFRAIVLHNAAVVLVPFRVGELGYPVLVRELINVPWSQCVRSLLWLRFQDGVVLIIMAFLILPFMNLELRLASLGLVAFLFVVSRKSWMLMLRSRHFLMRQLRAFLHQRSDGMGWLWSIANWISKIFVVSLLLQSLTNLDFLQTLKGALTGEMSALMPLTGPAGFGTYEVGVWIGLGLQWTQVSQLMSSILIVHVFFLFISLMLAFLFMMSDGFNGLFITSQKSNANA